MMLRLSHGGVDKEHDTARQASASASCLACCLDCLVLGLLNQSSLRSTRTRPPMQQARQRVTRAQRSISWLCLRALVINTSVASSPPSWHILLHHI
jgi:hypothetical protein